MSGTFGWPIALRPAGQASSHQHLLLLFVPRFFLHVSFSFSWSCWLLHRSWFYFTLHPTPTPSLHFLSILHWCLFTVTLLHFVPDHLRCAPAGSLSSPSGLIQSKSPPKPFPHVCVCVFQVLTLGWLWQVDSYCTSTPTMPFTPYIIWSNNTDCRASVFVQKVQHKVAFFPALHLMSPFHFNIKH